MLSRLRFWEAGCPRFTIWEKGGGPGGWIILDEPELGLGENILVPDLAGWKKMPIYARHKVSHAWLIDPIVKTLEVFKFEPEQWIVLGVYARSAKVHAAPFPELELDLGLLWLD